MKVYVYPADNYGCGFYRLTGPGFAALAAGADVVIVPPGSVTGIGVRTTQAGRVREVLYPQDADVVVVQRPSNRLLVDALPTLQAQGVAVVVDMDDDLSHIHPANPAWRGLHPKLSPQNNWHHIERACRQASLVTVSTEQLASVYGSHGRVRVVPNCVPARFCDVEHQPASDGPRFGWPGSLHSHPDDFREVSAVIARLIADGHRFHQVGPDEGMAELLGTDRFTSAGLIEFPDWIAAVATLDIGIAPLADTRFNSAKSNLKCLELSAAGVPWVASDVAEYRRFAGEGGGGSIAGRSRDWNRELRRLLGDPVLRGERGAAGRELVRDRHTIEGNIDRWIDAWSAAVVFRSRGILARTKARA